jgi:hypothetical protein
MHRFAVPLTAVITAASLTLAAGTTQSSDRTPTPIESASHRLPDAAVTAPVTIPLAAFDAGHDASQIDTITLDTSSVDPDRASVGLVPARVETNAATGARVMTGGLSGEPGRFVLAEVEGTIAGAVWTDDGAYDIRPVGDNGRVRLIRIDAINLPACATVGDAPPLDQIPLQQPGRVGGTYDTRGGQEDVIRVFVGFTAAGQAQMGGPNGANAVANAAIASANIAYDNSQMSVGDNGALNCRLELVGTYTVDPGTGLGASGLLGALRSQTDGVMDELHTLRDASGADMVALLSESGIGACGVAYLAPDNADRMFSVTAQSCAVGNLTFAHELGHNQGASHDADNAGSGYTSYGFGWRWNTSSGSLRRSIMAYSPGSRRQFFSNPDVFNSGGATGDAQQADNARLIGETFPTVASHRLGEGGGTGDCDSNGTPDLLEIIEDSTLDSNDNGVLDSCDLDDGLLDDCNNDGVADISQVQPRIELNPGPIFLFDFPPYTSTVSNAAESLGDVEITITADADLSGPNEYIDVFINGVDFGRLWELDGEDCAPAVTTTTINLSPAFWNALGPDVTIEVDRSQNVGANCSGDSVSISINYTGLNRALDANANGVIDTCEPNCNAADLAAPFGVLDLADVGAFVQGFTAQNSIADLTGDGVYDLEDIAAFVTGFNAGCA